MFFRGDFTTGLSLTAKRALFKLAVDLVKADNRIHSNEITFLDDLQKELELPQEEMDMIHYTSMQSAVESLTRLESLDRQSIIEFLSGIMKADSDIDFEESILLSAIDLSLGESSGSWNRVITTLDYGSDISSRQIVYLEKKTCTDPHMVLDDRYDNLLISKTLADVGLDLFYLPSIIRDIEDNSGMRGSRFGLLQRSMEYLIPAGDKGRIVNLEGELHSMDIPKFCNVVLSHHGIRMDAVPFDAFLLVKLRDNYLLDDNNDQHKATDYLCVDISQRVKERILYFVSKLDTQSSLLSYEGYYKILYDYLSSESKTASRILLDSNYDFFLKDIDNRKLQFESSPQSRTLYLLLLRYSIAGVSQECFNMALEFLGDINQNDYIKGDVFDINSFRQMLLGMSEPHTDLIYNLLSIYMKVSTKDALSTQFLGYISSILRHRSSLKNYINNGFLMEDKLSTPDRYCVLYNKETRVYYLHSSLSAFFCQRPDGVIIPLSEDDLWKQLV